MADSTIKIDFSSLGGATRAPGSSDLNAITDLKKAIDDLGLVIRNMPTNIGKAFEKDKGKNGKSTLSKQDDLLALQALSYRKNLKNEELRERVLNRQLKSHGMGHYFQRGVETFIGSQMVSRINSMTSQAIVANPLANPVARMTSIQGSAFGAATDTAAAAAGLVNPVAGLITYAVGSVADKLYTAFQGVHNQVAYSRYFMGQSYQLKNFSQSSGFNPDTNPYFMTSNAVASGMAQFGAGNISMKSANLISSLGTKLGMSPTDLGSFQKLGGIVTQLGHSMGGVTKTVDTLKSTFENFGGDPMKIMRHALSLNQTGYLSASRAIQVAAQTAQFGQGYAQQSTNFIKSPYIQRFRKELLGKALLGVDLQQLYSGTPTQRNAQASLLRSKIAKASFSSESFDMQSALLSLAGVEGKGFMTPYHVKSRNKHLLLSPQKLKTFDPVTQSAINAQHVVLNATNVAGDVASGLEGAERTGGMNLEVDAVRYGNMGLKDSLNYMTKTMEKVMNKASTMEHNLRMF